MNVTRAVRPRLRLLHPSPRWMQQGGSELTAKFVFCLHPQVQRRRRLQWESCDTRLVLGQCVGTCTTSKQDGEEGEGPTRSTADRQQGAFEMLCVCVCVRVFWCSHTPFRAWIHTTRLINQDKSAEQHNQQNTTSHVFIPDREGNCSELLPTRPECSSRLHRWWRERGKPLRSAAVEK